jgi:hypothetical protein
MSCRTRLLPDIAASKHSRQARGRRRPLIVPAPVEIRELDRVAMDPFRIVEGARCDRV